MAITRWFIWHKDIGANWCLHFTIESAKSIITFLVDGLYVLIAFFNNRSNAEVRSIIESLIGLMFRVFRLDVCFRFIAPKNNSPKKDSKYGHPIPSGTNWPNELTSVVIISIRLICSSFSFSICLISRSRKKLNWWCEIIALHLSMVNQDVATFREIWRICSFLCAVKSIKCEEMVFDRGNNWRYCWLIKLMSRSDRDFDKRWTSQSQFKLSV